MWSRTKFKQKLALLISASLLSGGVLYNTSCKKEESATIDPQEEYAGGSSTSFDFSSNAFGQPSPMLNAQQKTDFVVGNSFFKQNWVSAPASTTDRDGLGVLFNANSCSSCHVRDGRGLTPETSSDEPTGLLFRLSAPNGSPHSLYGGQLQNRAILGVNPEASVSVSYVEELGKYADGESYSLRKSIYTFNKAAYGELADALFSPRIAPQIIGMGLLEAIDESTILAHADPEDRNADGISGRANYILSAATGATVIGKLGWKANQPNVRQQTAGAFLGDLGITTSLFPSEDLSEAQKNLASLPNGGTPEIADALLDKVVLYTAALAVPARREMDGAEEIAGKALFDKAQCNACHLPKIQTGTSSELIIFHNQTIYPYTDLLLHDMGDGLADNRPDGLASGKEWKTPPLWGLGLIKTVNGQTFLMHDGRARSVEEAILWHGGEGQKSKEAFVKMSKAERMALVKFVNSL